MHHDSSITELLRDAVTGMDSAWREIVERYSNLIFAVCHRHDIKGADAQDVESSVWLLLVSGLTKLRQPEALPGWISTTTRNECLSLLRHRRRQIPTDSTHIDLPVDAELDAHLIDAERHTAVGDMVARLPQRDRELMAMLFADPPVPYKVISSTLGIPVGAIGPTRARCLTRARRTPAIAALAAERRNRCGHPASPKKHHVSQSESAAS